MEKRKFGSTGIEMPLLGMGVMRPPMLGDNKIDTAQVEAMFDTMYSEGVRYYDTAYVYLEGESEHLVRDYLVAKHPRDSFYIADKLPIDLVKEPEDCEKIFSTSLERLGTDYVDFYLLHGINYADWRECVRLGADSFQRALKESGRARHIGFSFHGSAADLEKILAEQSDWDFIQLQINYYDWYSSDTEQLYEMLRSHSIPCVVMEPVRGGSLSDLGDDVRELLTKTSPEWSNAAIAMRWVGSLPGVNVVLSGVSSIEQVRENVGVFSPLKTLGFEEEEAIVRAYKQIRSRIAVPCTACAYCGECPQGVDIKRVFRIANEFSMLKDERLTKWRYSQLVQSGGDASKCVGCGICASHCPQSIDIPGELKKCGELLLGVINKN